MPTPHPAPPIPPIARLPFFYGWAILACVCCAAVARQGPAVATLSIFVAPMTADFGWSRAAMSGAVSLGGVMAAALSPLIGPLLDRRGARLMLCAAVLVTGACNLALSLTESLVAFYVFFCIARMNFAGPFDIGIYGALNSWFVARRPLANAIVNLAHMAGLAAMPLIAYAAMAQHGWRGGWLAAPRCSSSASCPPGCSWCGGRRTWGSCPTAARRRQRRRGSRPARRERAPAPPSPPSRAPRRCARPPSGCCRSTPSPSTPCRPA
jgi:MFS family permease